METIRSTVENVDFESYQETWSALQQASREYLLIAEKAKQVAASTDSAYLQEQAAAIANTAASISGMTGLAGEIMATLNDTAAHCQILALSAAVEDNIGPITGEINHLIAESKAATAQMKILLADLQTGLSRSDTRLQTLERKKTCRTAVYWVLVTLITSDLVWAAVAYGSSRR